MNDVLEESKKKWSREVETFQERIAQLVEKNDKLSKSKKKLQYEFDDITVLLDNESSKFSVIDKKQRKFDQSLAEKKPSLRG